MTNRLSKNPSTRRDGMQSIQQSHNDVDSSLQVSGFLTSKIGARITLALSTTSVADDTETYTFFDGATQLYQIQLVYTSAAKTQLISAERIS
jgi:hypothetical protein